MVVVDDDRQEQGLLVTSATRASSENVGFMVRHGSGVVFAALTEERMRDLHIPPMVNHESWDPGKPTMGTSVDCIHGTTTGISAADRAHTLRALADRTTTPDEFARPGHVFPVRVHGDGLVGRRGGSEAAIALCTRAGLDPVAAITHLVDDGGRLRHGHDVRAFAATHQLTTVRVSAIATRQGDDAALRIDEGRLPTRHGVLHAITYTSADGSQRAVALVQGSGKPFAARPVPILRECLSGQFFDAPGCDCRRILDDSLARLTALDSGALVYLRASTVGNCAALEPDLSPSQQRLAADILADLGITARAEYRNAHRGR